MKVLKAFIDIAYKPVFLGKLFMEQDTFLGGLSVIGRWFYYQFWRITGLQSYRYNVERKLASFRARYYGSSTFCPLPWIHFSVSSDQTMRLCCNNEGFSQVRHSDGRPVRLHEVTSLKEYLNLPFLRQTRLQMLRGEEPKACSKCFDHERAGSLSMRQSYQVHYSGILRKMIKGTRKDGHVEPKIQYLDLAMGNNCNIRCRMCSPTSSKQLRKEFDDYKISYDQDMYARAKMGWSDKAYKEELFNEILPNTDQMLLTGGEPFLIEGQYRLLEQAIAMGRASHIKVTYHTNLTVLPERLIELWKHFKEIRVNGSIEAIGDLNDYIRYPSKWQDVDKNLRRLIELKKELSLWVEVHSVFQAYNLTRTTELLHYLLQFHKEMPAFPFFNYLHDPKPLKVNVLDRALREKTLIEIQSFIEENKHIYFHESSPFVFYNQLNYGVFKGYFDLMMEDDPKAQWSDFLNLSEAFDHSRQQSLKKVLPELFVNRSEKDSIHSEAQL